MLFGDRALCIVLLPEALHGLLFLPTLSGVFPATDLLLSVACVLCCLSSWFLCLLPSAFLVHSIWGSAVTLDLKP